MRVNSYKDYDGNIVKIGDYIEEVDYDGAKRKAMGKVISIDKQGYYVHPETHLCHRKHQLLGRWTRKVNK